MDGHKLKRPCVNCPFRTDGTAIRFSGEERAREIEESAYRHGFPCHKTAEHVEEDGFGDGGYYFGEGSQHCVGYSMMMLRSGYDSWPGISNDEAIGDYIRERVDWESPVFESVEEFFDANTKAKGE